MGHSGKFLHRQIPDAVSAQQKGTLRRICQQLFRLGQRSKSPDAHGTAALFPRQISGSRQELLMSCVNPVKKTQHPYAACRADIRGRHGWQR